MTETRVTPAAPKNFPIVRGSTRDILIGLYANLMGINDLPTKKNMNLENAIKFVDQPVAAKRQELFITTNRLITTADSLDASIARLKTQDKKLVEDNRYTEIADELRQRAVTLNKTEDELKAEYSNLVKEQTKVIREFLLADMQGEKVDPQKMVNLEIKQKAFTKSADQYFKGNKEAERDLDRLHKEVYSRIKNKSDLPMPEEEKKLVRRSGAAPAA